MEHATITIHLPTHRRQALDQQGATRTAVDAYDRNIGGYIRFLQDEGQNAGFRIETDNRDLDPPYSIEERGHEQKKAAHDWITRVPDLWEWLT